MDSGKWENVKNKFKLSENDAATALLEKVVGYIVDFSDYAEFAIVEP